MDANLENKLFDFMNGMDIEELTEMSKIISTHINTVRERERLKLWNKVVIAINDYCNSSVEDIAIVRDDNEDYEAYQVGTIDSATLKTTEIGKIVLRD